MLRHSLPLWSSLPLRIPLWVIFSSQFSANLACRRSAYPDDGSSVTLRGEDPPFVGFRWWCACCVVLVSHCCVVLVRWTAGVDETMGHDFDPRRADVRQRNDNRSGGGGSGGAAAEANWREGSLYAGSGDRGNDDEAPEEKLVAMGETKEASSPPPGRGFAFAARRRRQAFARPLVGPPQFSLL